MELEQDVIQENQITPSTTYTKEYKVLVYLMTLIIQIFFVAVFGVTGRLKKPISDDLQLTQSLLGLGDNLSYISRLIGTIYIFLKPPIQLKRDLVLHSTLVVFCMALISLGNFYPTLGKQIYLLGMLLGGFSRAYLVTPGFIVLGVLGSSSMEKLSMNFWFAFSYLGDVAGIMVIEILVINWGLSWWISLLIFLGAFLFFTLIFHFVVDQIDISTAQSDQNQDYHSISALCNYTLSYFKKLTNVLFTTEYTLLGITFYTIFLWLPYFFLHIGYQSTSSIISISFALSVMVGNFIYTIIVYFIFKFRNVGIFTTLLILFNVIICFFLKDLRDDPSSKVVYLILIILFGLFLSGPQLRVLIQEIKERSSSNHEAYLILMINRFSHQFISGLMLLLNGFMLQSNIYSLFFYLMIVAILSLTVHALRVWLYPLDFMVIGEEQLKNKQDDHQ